MDPTGLVEEEFSVDLESSRSHDESVCGKDRTNLLNYDSGRVYSVVIDVIAEGVDMNMNVDVDEKKLVKEEERKKMSNKKPPRPPRGPSIDATDLKFIKQMTELTVLKRIQTERIKALKKMKVAKKTSSSSYTFFATMFTIIFCCVILLQGICNKTTSNASIDGSPSSLSPEPGLISVQYVSKPYTTHSSSTMFVSGSPSVIEQVSGQDQHEIT